MRECRCCATAPQELPGQSRELLDRGDLTRPLLIVQEAGRFIDRAHAALRRHELSVALGVDGGTADRVTLEREIAQARRCAVALAEDARRASPEREDVARWQARNRDAAEGALGAAREMFVGSLQESGLPPADALESLEIWDSTVATLRERGVAGVFDEIASRADELDAALRQDQDWGRAPHSPLETWQWIVIAIILCIAVAAVIVCLIWFGCSWFYWIFVGACVATGAFGGWIGLCAGFGF